jgi:uncharacterized protein (TIGR03435 family)
MSKFTVMLCVAALGAGFAAGQSTGQPATPSRDLQFEVATIHPSGTLNAQDVLSGKMNVGVSVNGNQVTIRYLTIRDLAVGAWEVKPFDVKAPEWMGQQRFDITALLPEGATEKDMPQLLRSLLQDRFKMMAHKESKESEVYALMEARGGHKMKPSPELAPQPLPDADQPPPDPAKQTGPGMTINGQRMNINQTPNAGGGANVSISGGRNGAQKVSVTPEGNMHMEIERLTMAELAQQLGLLLDLPVEDHTGLSGSFQVALDLTMADMQGMMSKLNAASGGGMLPPDAQARIAKLAAADPGGAVLGSVSKLGLRLEKQKGSISTLVIDSAEKTPTEN